MDVEVLLLILLPINLGLIDNNPLTGGGHGLMLLQPISELFHQYSMDVSGCQLQGCQLTFQCHGGLVLGSLTAEGICLHSGYFLCTLSLGGINLLLCLLLDLMLLGISFLQIPSVLYLRNIHPVKG